MALTSHIMKTLEELIMEQVQPMVQSLMDPLQFAYQPNIGVDNATIYGAFDTIHPALLCEKLTTMYAIMYAPSLIVGEELDSPSHPLHSAKQPQQAKISTLNYR